MQEGISCGMQRARLPLALLGILLVATGCATRTTSRVQPDSHPLHDRAAFIERRSEELIRRGAPKDAALAKASGEWFSSLMTADKRTEDNQHSEQRILERKLAEMSRTK